MDRTVAGICVFVYFTVTNTPEASGTGQPCAEAANSSEHIKIANQIMNQLLPVCHVPTSAHTAAETLGRSAYRPPA